MKDLVVIAITIALVLCGANAYFRKEKLRRMSLIQNSFESGCYFHAQRECDLSTDKDACYDRAVDYCPKGANQFRSWIENIKK